MDFEVKYETLDLHYYMIDDDIIRLATPSTPTLSKTIKLLNVMASYNLLSN